MKFISKKFSLFFSIYHDLRTTEIIDNWSITNQWLKILGPIDYSSITHWISDIINDLSTDYPSITYWLLIDFIDVID